MRNLDAITEQDQKALAAKRVLIVGCGGLGGYVIEALARIGVGRLRVVDGDVFKESDLNRQLFSSSMNIGRPKTLAAKQRVFAINPTVEVEDFEIYLDADNAADLLKDCDLVVDALDNISTRFLLAQACSQAGLAMVHGAIGSWYGHAALILPDSHLLDDLYPAEQASATLEPQAMLAPVAILVAALQAALAVRYLLGKSVANNTVLQTDLDHFNFEQFTMS